MENGKTNFTQSGAPVYGGCVLTAGLCTLFSYGVLRLSLETSLLLGAVISSTDAASVFSILRSRNLSLKYGTASILEVESGSNDPFSYMLTMIVLQILAGGSVNVPLLLAEQILIGGLCGAFMGKLTGHRFVGRKISELKLWDLLVVMIKREGKALLPRGNVTLREGDVLVLSGESYQEDTAAYLDERLIEEGHPWIGNSLAELSDTLKSLIVMIQRSDGELAVPKGDTRIEVGDLLVFTKPGLKESTQSVQVGKIDE